MKRSIVVTLVVTLVLALALPGVAFAKKGGVPANGKDKGKAAAVVPSVPDEAPAEKGKGNANANANGKGKGADAVKAAGVDGDLPDAGEPDVSGETTGAASPDETAGEPAGKLTGIENALSRLQRNLERKQARFQAGLSKGLPPGLQATIVKFMSWLGMDEAEEPGEGDGSEETSGTVEPTDPEGEPTDPELPADDTLGAPTDTP